MRTVLGTALIVAGVGLLFLFVAGLYIPDMVPGLYAIDLGRHLGSLGPRQLSVFGIGLLFVGMSLVRR